MTSSQNTSGCVAAPYPLCIGVWPTGSSVQFSMEQSPFDLLNVNTLLVSLADGLMFAITNSGSCDFLNSSENKNDSIETRVLGFCCLWFVLARHRFSTFLINSFYLKVLGLKPVGFRANPTVRWQPATILDRGSSKILASSPTSFGHCSTSWGVHCASC